MTAGTPLLLVRHAHAGVRGTWPGNDLERELCELGRGQADALHGWLVDRGELPDGRVTTSAAVRCVDTVTPLAARLGAEVEVEPLLLEGADPAATCAWLAGADDVGVACSHGDVIGGVLALLDRRGVLVDEPVLPKCGTWVLERRDGEIVRATHHPPPDG